jgi:hypothetical protein
MLALSPLDAGSRADGRSYLRDVVRAPWKAFSKAPYAVRDDHTTCRHDANGALSMCDGCPDITVHDDKLVWSCRMEELINFGDWIRPVPEKQVGV